MKVTPGDPIPLWFRLWDSNPSRFIQAHITDLDGNDIAGSPIDLSYCGDRGIYVGTGPVMGTSLLVADYQTYLDSGYTQVDRSYLPASDWVEPDLFSLPLTARLTAVGVIDNAPLEGSVDENAIEGVIEPQTSETGVVGSEEPVGKVQDLQIEGRVQDESE